MRIAALISRLPGCVIIKLDPYALPRGFLAHDAVHNEKERFHALLGHRAPPAEGPRARMCRGAEPEEDTTAMQGPSGAEPAAAGTASADGRWAVPGSLRRGRAPRQPPHSHIATYIDNINGCAHRTRR